MRNIKNNKNTNNNESNINNKNINNNNRLHNIQSNDLSKLKGNTANNNVNTNTNTNTNSTTKNKTTKTTKRSIKKHEVLFYFIICIAVCMVYCSHLVLQSNNYYGYNDQESMLSLFSTILSKVDGNGNADDDDVNNPHGDYYTDDAAAVVQKINDFNKHKNENIHKNNYDDNDDDIIFVNQNNKSPISYTLMQNLSFNNTFDLFYKCNPKERKSPPKQFSKPNNIFDFHVQISTSLNILYMGDSVAMQFSQALQEATGATYNQRHVLRYAWRDHEALHITSPVRGGGSVAGWRITGMLKANQIDNHWQMAPVAGGGWMEIDLKNIKRSLAFLSNNANENKTLPLISTTNLTTTSSASASASALALPPMEFYNVSSTFPPNDCRNSMETLRHITKIWDTNNSNIPDPLQKCPEKDFDVMIHQIPFGWFPKPSNTSISYNIINETVHLSHTMFGANIVILQTVPVGNNLRDFETELVAINDMIYNYTNTFVYSEDNPIKAVLVMDVARLSIELFTENALALGLIEMDDIKMSLSTSTARKTTIINPYKASSSTFKSKSKFNNDNPYIPYTKNQTSSIMKKLNPLLNYKTECCHYYYPQIIGFTCAENVKNFTKHCTRNQYSLDGHHWCLNEVGGRIHGSAACLIKCGVDFNDSSMNTNDNLNTNGSKFLKDCEQRCNDQYMSLKPIPFDEDGILYNY